MSNSEEKGIGFKRYGPGALCRMDKHILDAIKREDVPGKVILGICATILVGTLVYGFIFGLWRSPLQGLYSAIKMPLLFFSTVLASAVINTMLTQVLGARLSLRQVCASILLGMAISAAIMGAVSPVILFFVLQIPSPDPSVVGLSFNHPAVDASKHMYWVLLLTHVSVIGVSGIAGNIRLYHLLKVLTGTRRMALYLMSIWISVAGFAGCQLSWLLSPFLCKPTQLPHIVPKEYFQENFYERVWRAIMDLM
ncbi:hypothetical protein ACFLS1_11885 [Verrucomicrobiota bacterium]